MTTEEQAAVDKLLKLLEIDSTPELSRVSRVRLVTALGDLIRAIDAKDTGYRTFEEARVQS